MVPALLGLKGNLEMTLASRLSTAVSVQEAGGYLLWEGFVSGGGGWAGKIPKIPCFSDSRQQSLELSVLGRGFHPAGLMGFEGLMVLKLC